MNIEKYICELLYRHECVIVPEFGGFITNFQPARIDDTTHTIFPPRKALVFNSNLTINDGLLATEISSRMGCSFDEAIQLIRRDVTAWRERLKSGKTILLPGLGSFENNNDGKAVFHPDAEQNFFGEAFGLNSLVVQPLQTRSRKSKFRDKVHQKPLRKTTPRLIRRTAWAAAITIPLVAASVWSIMNYDTIRQYTMQHSGLISILRPEPKPVTEAVFPAEEVVPQLETREIADIPAEDLLADVKPEEAFDPPPEARQMHADSQTRAYHIIIGSFENIINAQQLAEEMNGRGWDARVVAPEKGMHRVSIASFVIKEEALGQLSKIREESNPNAWLLRF
jgi:hypothetical protein